VATVFFIFFERCDKTVSKNTCKSDEEVDEWLKDKYLLLAYDR
jgi:hypothetical protein